MRMAKSLTVFYAWQSDTASASNRNALRVALTEAAAELEDEYPGLTILIDEATRGMAGAGNVPDSIRDKIEACDIFLGDVTTINPDASAGTRKVPNPNVVYETGFASALLGWNRVILVTNLCVASMDDLPFDFDRHRVTSYNIQGKPDSGARKQLAKLMATALRAIMESDPKRPADLRQRDPVLIRRERDIENARWAMSNVSIPHLQEFIEELPGRVSEAALFFYEGFHGVVTSNNFHIYDPELADAFKKLDQAWSAATSFGSHYYQTPSGLNVFGTPRGLRPHPDEEKALVSIGKAARQMRKHLDRLLAMLRTNYIEIDLDETDRQAIHRRARDLE
jgi:hypothetical protein